MVDNLDARPLRPASARRQRRWQRPVIAAACAAGLLLAATLAQAQWKWRDASGVTHFSDRPPPASVPDKDILQRPGAARRAPSGTGSPATAQAAEAGASAAGSNVSARAADGPRSKSLLDQQVEARRKSEEQERAARARADEERQAAVRADNCSRARSALAMLDSGQRVSRVNAKGEREVLDDRQRADEGRRAREIIASDCR